MWFKSLISLKGRVLKGSFVILSDAVNHEAQRQMQRHECVGGWLGRGRRWWWQRGDKLLTSGGTACLATPVYPH